MEFFLANEFSYKITDTKGQCYDNTTNMSGKKPSVTAQMKSLTGKCLHIHGHGRDLKLADGGMIKNKPILCNQAGFMHFVQQTRAQKANHVLPSEIIMVVKELVVMVIDED